MAMDPIMRPPTFFSPQPANGPYMWEWASFCGLRGDGFAPTSMGAHHFITRAALETVPAVREWLRGEAELLTWTYCGFPDMNWGVYGTHELHANAEHSIRYPDYRREWDISRYCRFNPVAETGAFIPHHPKGARHGFADRYADALAAAASGRARDAVRFLGAALHYLQDCGSPPHAGEISGALHRPAEAVRDPARIAILGYCPEPDFEALALADSVAALGREQCTTIIQKLTADPEADILAEQLVCANGCARACADALLAFHTATADTIDFEPEPAPVSVELLHNGCFGDGGDEPWVPDGWVMWWADREDDQAILERIPIGDAFSLTLEYVVSRVACLPSWPRAIRCVSGQLFELSATLEVSGPRAGLTACFHDDATRPLARFDVPAAGTGESETISACITAPANAEILRVGAYGEHCLNPALVHHVSARCRK